MNFTEKLKEVLSWIASHAQRLSRKGLELPNHLANARIHLLQYGKVVHTIVLDREGRLSAAVTLDAGPYRLEVRDSAGELLFTQDTFEAA